MKKNQRCLILAVLLFVVCLTPALAADTGKTPQAGSNPSCDASSGKNCSPPEGQDPFRGLKWGLGVAVSSSLGGIGSVTIDPNTKIVHVTKLNSSAARGAFELHYFFKFCDEHQLHGGSFFSGTSVWTPAPSGSAAYGSGTYECRPQAIQYGMGPFVSLNTSPFDTSGNFSVKLFDSIGAGWMIGINAYDAPDPTTKIVHTLNFGIGAILDTSVNQLAVGVQDGQITSVPAANQNSLIVQTTKIGWMAIVSYRLFEVNLK
jgi:hypothetical protein